MNLWYFFDRFFVESYSQTPNSFEVEEGVKKKFEEARGKNED